MKENSKKVLVIGKDGQLGKSIYDCVGIFKHPELPIEWTFASHDDIDITDMDSVHNFFVGKKFNYVINCAAYTDVANCETTEGSDIALDVNSVGPDNLAFICVGYGMKLIHISTDYVFDGYDKTPKKEDSLIHPINEYGRSKLLGEYKLMAYDSLDYMIIRISTLYSVYGNNIVKTLSRLIKEHKHINTIYDNIFNITNAGDLAEFIVYDIIVNDNFHKGILNYGNTGEFSTYDLACLIAEELGEPTNSIIPVPMIQYVTNVSRPMYSSFNFAKINELYDNPLKDGRERLKIFMKFLKNAM